MPKVSVIIPSYNHEKYVRLAIESVLNQTFQDFEIIVCDDGSTDNSVNIIKNIKDTRIRLISLKGNRGVANAINACLQHTKGKYIAHLNSDDIFAPSKLERQVNYLESHKLIGAVFSYADLIDENGNKLLKNHHHEVMNSQNNQNKSEWLHYFFYKCRWLWHPSMMMRKSVYNKIGNHNPRLAQIHDFDLGIRLSMKFNIHIIKKPLLQFRIRAGKMNVSADTLQAKVRSMFEFSQVLKQFLLIPTIEEFLKIFPDTKGKYNDITDNDLIPFYVARQALEVPHMFHQKFAMDTIYELLGDKKIVEKLENICHFSYLDFIKITGKHDIYHVQHIEYQENVIKDLSKQLEDMKSIKSMYKFLLKKILFKLGFKFRP